MKIRFLDVNDSICKSRVIVSLFVVLALILCTAFTARAQNFTASVRGTVMDEQGAAIVGADVTITSTDTGYSRNEKSDKDGSYGFQSLPIGRYTLHVTKEGFKAFEEKDVVLHVNDSLTVDAQLKLGAKTETVEVVANTAQVELSNAELSGTVAGAQITQLPLNGRSFAELLTLVPGVEVDNGFSYDKKGLNGGADISISGGASNANLFLVDGANNVDVGSNRTILIYPSIDSIEEFKVERNSYNAQFGGAGGGIVSLVTKSGTNDFHGSAYYFGRNDFLDSKDTILKAFNPKAKKDSIRRNDFGGSVGGPIMKDKIFFFGSEEWNRLIQESVRSAHVPTPLQRTGDFSDSALDPAAASASTTGCLLKGGLVDSDPNNPVKFTSAASTPGIIDVIPAARQSVAGPAILNTYFLPTLAQGAPNYGCGTNWAKAEKQPTYFREDSWRGDVRLSKTLTLMMKYTNDAWTFGPSAVGNTGWGADSGASQIQESWSSPGRILVGRLSKTIGTSAVNDFQFSYSRNRINISQATPSAAQALNKLIPTFFPPTGNPANNPPVWINGGGLPTIWSFAPWNNGEDLYAWQDDFSKVIRHHTVKFGVLYSRNSKDQDNFSQKQGVTFGPGGYNGCKNFGGTPTSNPGCSNLVDTTTHYGLADWILQNQAVNWGEQDVIFKKKGRWENFELYINDDLKLTSRLTLNLGVRYSYLPNPYQADDLFTVFNQAAFNPSLLNAPCNGLFYSAGLLSNPCPPGTGGLPGPNRAIQNNYNRAFAPRLGVAWDPTGSGKWAVRAGFGQFYNRDDIFVTDGTAGTNPPFVRSFTSNNGNGRFLDNTNQLPACVNSKDVNGNVIGCFGAGGFGVPGIGQDLSSRAPYTLQYNLTIQHEFWKDTRLEVGYVGSRSKNWTSKYDANAIAPTDRLNFAQANGSDAGNLLKPFHVLKTGGLPVFAHHGSAEYDSLQSAFSMRFQRNSIFQLTYTYSKIYADTLLKVSNGGGNLVIDPFNLKNGYGLNPLNRPHIFSANVIYNLPTFQNMERYVRAALGSWEVSSIVNISSGNSLTPTIGGISGIGDPSGIGNGAGAQRPNLVPGQPCRNPSFANFQWVNPNRYTVNGLKLGTIGNAPVGDCLGPPTRTVDLSVSKYFRITERIKAQFRMDAFNLFNHPQYGDPGGGSVFGANYSIGFNALNCVPGATGCTTGPEFLDKNGNGLAGPPDPKTGLPTPTPVGQAVSIQNATPNRQVGTVGTQSDRNREFQYSIRFTF